VLSSIAIFDIAKESFEIVSIGFGTKALPYEIVKSNKGDVLGDMHA
jgi:hypothetical protein